MKRKMVSILLILMLVLLNNVTIYANGALPATEEQMEQEDESKPLGNEDISTYAVWVELPDYHVYAQIAADCKTTTAGTYLSDMRDYMNSIQSKDNYVISYNAPPIIGLKFSKHDGWFYSINGHFVSVCGVRGDKSEFKLADPWIGYSASGLDGYPGMYNQTATKIYDAYQASHGGLMW